MRGSFKFALCVVLSISFLLSCSLFLLNAEADASLEKINMEDNLIRIQTQQENPVIDVELLENTDHCLTSCYAILKIHPYQDIFLPNQADSEFDWNFVKEKPWMDGLVSHHFEILKTREYKADVPEFGTVLVDSTCYDENNQSYACKEEQTAQTGSHEETRYRYEFKPFEFWGQILKANQDYTIKLVGKKRARLETNNVDWIPTIMGFELREWEWWNSDWDKCVKFFNITTIDVPENYETKITFSNSNIPYERFLTNAADVRFTNGTECNENGGTELDFFAESYNISDTSTNLTFWVEMDRNYSSILMYYNASGVSSASNGTNTFMLFDGFEYTDSPTNHGWTAEGSGTASTSTSYPFHGSRSLKLNSTGGSYWVEDTSDVSDGIAEVWFYDFGDLQNQVLVYYDSNNNSLVGHKSDGCGSDEYAHRFGTGAGSWGCTGVANTTGWHKFGVHYDGTDYHTYVDDIYTGTDSGSYGAPSKIVIGDWWGGNSPRYWDSFRIRHYVETEPTWSIGTEEEEACPSDDSYINDNSDFPNRFCHVPDSGNTGVLIINASNIIVDCNDMILNGSHAGVGIYNRGFHNVTLRDCKAQNYDSDIKFNNDLIAEVKESVSFYE